MARTIRTIEAVASSSGMEVDRKAGIIHGVKILGLVSDNNRKYMPEAVRKAKSLYEGIKVNIDHPAESGDVRSAEDRFGKLINVEYVEGEGLYGDLMFLKSHPMAERICEAAERNDMNDTFGLSHNAQGDGQEDDDGCFVVSSIVEVRHVDLVADPATTKSLREARTRMKAKESKQKPYASLYKGMWTVQDSNGKDIYSIPNKQYAIKFLNDNWDKLSSGTMQPHSSVKTKESDMPDDEDEMMTEAGSSIITHAESKGASMKEATDFNAIKKFQDTLKNATTKQVLAYHIGNTGGKIKSKDYTAAEVGGKQAMIGDILRSKFGSKAVEEFFAQEKSSTTKRTKESDMRDDEDEMMTEAEDVPMEDPSEEEVTEAADLGPLKRLMPIIDKAMNELEQFEKQMSSPGSQTKIGNTSSRNLQIAGEKLWDARSLINSIKNIEESKCEGMSDDEDKMMTEASGGILGPIMQEVTSNIGKSKEALKAAMIKGATIRHAIKGPLGAKITAELTKVLKDANGALDTLSMRVHSLEKDPAWANESVESDDEDEMMTEADDMPMEDPSEEEVTEAASETDTARKLLAKAYDLARSGKVFDAAQELISISTGKSGITSARIKSLAKRIASELIPLSSDLDRIRADLKQYSTSIEESEGDPEDDMPVDEADDMSIDDITDKPAVEAYGEEDDTPMDEADDEEKMAEGSGSSGDGSSYVIQQWEDGKFNKQGGLEYPTKAAAQAVADRGTKMLHPSLRGGGVEYRVVKIDSRGKVIKESEVEDEYTDDKDKMAMESKQYRKLQQFCKKNNMVLTRDLYKDLRPLSESAQQRCILRIKLASKARKPRSSGSMMPMTESKVYTGDNVFNWLRS